MTKQQRGLKDTRKLFSLFQWCMAFSWRTSRFYTCIRVMCVVAAPLLVIGTSFVGKEVINLLAGVTVHEERQAALLILLIGLLVLALSSMLLSKLNQYVQSMHEDVFSSKISLELMDKSLAVDLEYYDNPNFYDKIMAALHDSHAIVDIVWHALSCFSSVISFICIFSILLQVNMVYALIIPAVALPSSIVTARYTKLLYQLSLEQIKGLRIMSYCQGIASNRDYAQAMRLYGTGEWIKNKYERIWQSLFDSKKAITRKRAFLTGLLECSPELIQALIGVDIAFAVLQGNATVGDYSLYTGLVSQLIVSITLLSSSVMQIYDNRLKLDNIRMLEVFKNQISNTEGKRLCSINSIELDHVSFSYPASDKMVLKDLTLTFKKNERIALVGLNGSGKSTLIKLLLRMYDPSEGTIRINGIDIKEYNLTALRANFGVYFQDMRNFSFSLRENIVLSDIMADEDSTAIYNALYATYSGDILAMAKHGLDTEISRMFDESGLELSGGQQQKLALSRALFRNRSALILDEPSSSLDPLAEHEVFKSLAKLTEGKMTFFTSHRLSNVSLADRIIVIEDGRITEDGTQDELLRLDGRYAELFRYQQEKYLVAE